MSSAILRHRWCTGISVTISELYKVKYAAIMFSVVKESSTSRLICFIKIEGNQFVGLQDVGWSFHRITVYMILQCWQQMKNLIHINQVRDGYRVQIFIKTDRCKDCSGRLHGNHNINQSQHSLRNFMDTHACSHTFIYTTPHSSYLQGVCKRFT